MQLNMLRNANEYMHNVSNTPRACILHLRHVSYNVFNLQQCNEDKIVNEFKNAIQSHCTYTQVTDPV